jgi:hypothetical protein
MRGLAALVLAGVLVAPASFAQILGDQSGILGGESGFVRPTGSVAAVTIDAMPFARTVTCSDYTLTGTAPGAGAVSWAASPSGASGACTGTTSWSCVVDVAPDAVGEGVETITVSQSGATGGTVTIGFYVEGEHSCFLAQSYDGAYNAGKADLAAVATWVNLGSSALNVTQAVGSAQPTYRTGIVGGQPVVRCDGGDRVAAATAADWTFLADGTDATSSLAVIVNSTATRIFLSTSNFNETSINSFNVLRFDTNASQTRINGAAQALSVATGNNTFNNSVANEYTIVINDDAGAGVDGFASVNGGADVTAASTSPYALTSAAPLTICAGNTGQRPHSGDMIDILIYASALSATQSGINHTVREWALGGTLPVTP